VRCLHARIAALQATVFPDRDRQYAAAEINNPLDLVMMVVPRRPVADEEVTDRRYALVDP